MPEFNRNFALGKMNKDLDERLVPAGGYRDALNVEVSTSEGSDVGALQTIWGNTEVTPDIVPAGSYCVGSLINNEENCIYWLVAGGEEEIIPNHFIKKDFIIKYNVDTGLSTYVFVDIYSVRVKVQGTVVGGQDYIILNSNQGIRPGMVARFNNNNAVVERLHSGINVSDTNVYIETGFNISTISFDDELIFESRRVLNFSKYQDITGINIVDDFIMFTDDISEPKMVSIKRSIMGTGGVAANGLFSIGEGQDAVTHTRLISERRDGTFVDDGFEVVNNPSYPDVFPEFSELENNTTIKKNPLTPPTLFMSSTGPGGAAGNTVSTVTFLGFVSGTPAAVLNTGTQVTLQFDDSMGLIPGDFVVLTNDLTQSPTSFTNFDIRLQVDSGSGNTFTLTVLSIDPDLSTDAFFYVNKQQTDPLFEFKFPRFGYRYKYVDGQYSAFSPFSEIAFLPGPFSYDPLEGYNLAMANRLRTLRVENYAPHPDNRPKDVVEIDILYKEDKSPVIYTVKTISRYDGSPLWPEDNPILAGTGYMGAVRGSMGITSELIHAVVPENQLLRPWDNVPRLAKAQEVSGNRLIYGNYLQSYDLLDVNNKLINPTTNLSAVSNTYLGLGTTVENPLKSIKTMRTYQLGVVYRDEMGRETPVLADKEGGSIYLGKEFCDQQSQLVTRIENNAPNWATSFKFFIKETSNEYFNLALNRWYNAEDGNVWLSFQSSDRNKLDIETFLELKKAHDTTVPVTEPARYKVLAIENEAPQYIKLDRKSQGLFVNGTILGDANNLIGDSVQGFPLDSNNFITLRTAEFQATFDTTSEQNILSIASECSLKIRSVGGERSEWYSISRIEEGTFFGSGASDGYKITVEDAFGPDVNFCSTGNSFATRVSGLIVEITRDEFVDKPEFDGKFFVKVFRDRVLEDNVMILDDDDLVVINAYPVAYLHTYKTQTSGTGYVANTSSDAFGIAGNVSDKYYEGLAGNGQAAGASGGAGSATCHPHPFGHTNFDGGLYRWGDNSASITAGDLTGIPHPYLTLDACIGIPDPSEEEGPDTNSSIIEDGLSAAFSAPTALALYLAGGVAAFVVAGLGFASTILAPNAGHRGIGKWEWGSQFWSDLCTRVDTNGNETYGHPFVFIDDAWAVSWCYTDHMCHNDYQDALGGDGSSRTKEMRASRFLHSAPWVGDYGAGPIDNSFDDNINGIPGNDENEEGYADLLAAPWIARSSSFNNQIDVNDNYFSSTTNASGDDYLSGEFNTINDPDYRGLRQTFNFSRANAPTWAQNGSNGVRGNLIDISVAGGMPGMGSSNNGVCGDDDGSSADNMRFMRQTATAVEQELTFFNQLLTNGVRWRFREDPDNTLYTTQDYYEHYGIVNSQRSDASTAAFDTNQWYHSYNKRNKFTIQVDPSTPFGSGPSGWLPTANVAHDGSEAITFEIMGPYSSEDSGPPSDNPAIFETHPKEDVGLDIYYEIGRAYPVRISKDDDETLTLRNSNIIGLLNALGVFTPLSINISEYEFNTDPNISDMVKLLTPGIDMDTVGINNGDVLRVRDTWGGAVDIVVTRVPLAGEEFVWIDPNIHNKRIELPWHNCYVFGNGVESDRIRDDFNQPTIQNGVKASTTIAEQYKEERRKEGLIFSGIFNSRTGVNRLNQFIQAEAITKDLNPDNGSIQKLFARDTDIVTFCEDKVLKILSQKDALFNADGNTNVTATSKVLGAAVPFQGDYGISKNPESFAADNFRCYFADVQNGAVLRLSKDGITNISDYGMRDWFTDKFYSLDNPRIIGSFDARKENYNITITNRTGSVSVVPYQNVNPGEMMFTGITAGMYENGLGHIEPVFDNHPPPHPDPTPPSDPIETDTDTDTDTGPNTQFSTDCESFWMPPEGPDALPNVPGFPECGWPLNGQFVIGNTTYFVAGYASTEATGAYSQTQFSWNSVLNPNSTYTISNQNLDHVFAHGAFVAEFNNQ